MVSSLRAPRGAAWGAVLGVLCFGFASGPMASIVPPTDYPDVRILNGRGDADQVAYNPVNSARLVVGIARDAVCYVKRSTDGGKTWGRLIPLPQPSGAQCSWSLPPAVAYSADGSLLYAAYVHQKSTDVLGIQVSSSADGGLTWSAPTIVFGDFSFYDGGFFGVRLAAAPDDAWVYVAAWREDYGGGGFNQEITLSSSEDQGASWTPQKRIAFASPETYELEDLALAAGRNGTVLVAYGWGYPSDRLPNALQVARSSDHGATFTYGLADQYPSDGGISLRKPVIEIGPLGTAHLVYRKQDYPASEILYKFSLPPYSAWSAAPVRLDDDAGETGYLPPQLAVGSCGSAGVLHVTWVTRNSQVLYSRKLARSGYRWSEPLTVGSLKGDIYRSGLAAAGARAFSIFSGSTTAVPPTRWAIAGSRVWSGITCP